MPSQNVPPDVVRQAARVMLARTETSTIPGDSGHAQLSDPRRATRRYVLDNAFLLKYSVRLHFAVETELRQLSLILRGNPTSSADNFCKYRCQFLIKQ